MTPKPTFPQPLQPCRKVRSISAALAAGLFEMERSHRLFSLSYQNLKQTQRIHIHQYSLLRNIFLLIECQQFRDSAGELRALRRLQQKLEAVLAFEPRQRRGGRPQHFYPARFLRRQKRGDLARPSDGVFNLRVPHQNAGQRSERRIMQQSPELYLLLKKSKVVLPRGQLDRVVLRIVSLDEYFPAQVTASGAARDLRQQLKPALRCSELR